MIPSSSFVNDFIFEHSTNGILVANSSGQIEGVNPAAAALLKTPIRPLIGTPAQQAFAGNPALCGLFSGEASLEVSLPAGGYAAGTGAWLEDGRRIVLLEDVTARRSLDINREDLLLRIAHDLRNPVASLIGYADLIESLGDLNEEQRHFLNRTRTTGVKFYATIADLVDLAWIEADMPLRHTPVDLSECVTFAVESLTPLALEKRIAISVTVEANMPPVSGDVERLHALVAKLLHNAIVYSAEGQSITLNAWSDKQSVCCSVSDQGIGIAENDLELVFDRLYRSGDPRVQEIPGGGLGLTTARSIAQHHGGEILAESVLNAGSTFTLRLPAASG